MLTSNQKHSQSLKIQNVFNFILDENHDIAIAMSSSRADPVLGKNIQLGWLGVFKYLNQCHFPGWENLNV